MLHRALSIKLFNRQLLVAFAFCIKHRNYVRNCGNDLANIKMITLVAGWILYYELVSYDHYSYTQ